MVSAECLVLLFAFANLGNAAADAREQNMDSQTSIRRASSKWTPMHLSMSDTFCRLFGCSRNDDPHPSQQKPVLPEFSAAKQPEPARAVASSTTYQEQPCGVPAFEPSKYRIINGADAVPHSWPWMAHINAGGSSCGATLISPDVVLTAAHCLEKYANPSDIIVVVGAHNRWGNSEGQIRVRVFEVAKHEQYNSFTVENDIALLRLERALTLTDKVRVSCFPTSSQTVSDGTECVIIGWGTISNYGQQTSRVLKQATIPVRSNNECRNRFGYNKFKDSMVCAGGEGKDTCLGDSGGPLLCKQGNQWFVHGLTSWGYEQCGVPGIPAAYTRVSSYATWIKEKLSMTSWPHSTVGRGSWGNWFRRRSRT